MAAPKEPKGAKSDKEWREAIRRAVYDLRADPSDGKKVKALVLLARSLVDRALAGDVTALKEIGDRLDGRPTQPLEASGKDGGPIEFVMNVK